MCVFFFSFYLRPYSNELVGVLYTILHLWSLVPPRWVWLVVVCVRGGCQSFISILMHHFVIKRNERNNCNNNLWQVADTEWQSQSQSSGSIGNKTPLFISQKRPYKSPTQKNVKHHAMHGFLGALDLTYETWKRNDHQIQRVKVFFFRCSFVGSFLFLLARTQTQKKQIFFSCCLSDQSSFGWSGFVGTWRGCRVTHMRILF